METKSSQFYQDLQIEITYSNFHTLPPWSLFPAQKTRAVPMQNITVEKGIENFAIL